MQKYSEEKHSSTSSQQLSSTTIAELSITKVIMLTYQKTPSQGFLVTRETLPFLLLVAWEQ